MPALVFLLGNDEGRPFGADIQPVQRSGGAGGGYSKVPPVNDIHIVRAAERDLIKVLQGECPRLIPALFGLTTSAPAKREGHGQKAHQNSVPHDRASSTVLL